MSSKTGELTWLNVNLADAKEIELFDEQELAASRARARSAIEDLKQRGILDSDGRRVRKDTPPDMREESSTDFGG